MDYGLKYYFEFTAQTSGIPFRVEILKQNYTGPTKRLSIGASPVLSVEEESEGVRGSSLQLSLECKIEGMLSELYTTNNREWLVREYSQRGNQMAIIWQGYILPELYTEMWVDAPYDVQVTAVDGLGLLKFVDYSPTYTRKTLKAILSQILENTGLDLPFHILTTLRDRAISNTIYEHINVNDSMFAGKTCYEALQEIMTATGASITQHENRWTIRRWKDINVESAVEISSNGKTTLPMRLTTLGKIRSAELYPIGSLQMDIVPALSGADFEFEYRSANSMFLNGAMNSDAAWNAFGSVEKPGIVTQLDGKKYNREMYVLKEQDAYIEQEIDADMNDKTAFNLDIDILPVYSGSESDLGSEIELVGKIEFGFRSYLEEREVTTNGYIDGYFLKYKDDGSTSWDLISYKTKEDFEELPEPIPTSDFSTIINIQTLITPDVITKGTLTRLSLSIPPIPKVWFDLNGRSSGISMFIKSKAYIKNKNASTKVPLDVYIGGVYLLPTSMPEGYNEERVVAQNASKSAGDVQLAFSDDITFDNSEGLLFNTINGVGIGEYIFGAGDAFYSFWGAFQQMYIDRYCQKRMQLSGTVMAPFGEMPVLVTEQHTGATMAVGAYSWTQEAEEVRVTLEEIPTTSAQAAQTDTINRPKGPNKVAGGFKATSVITRDDSKDTEVAVVGGMIQMMVEDKARVVVSGDDIGTNDEAPTTSSINTISNRNIGTTTSGTTTNISRAIPLGFITIPSKGCSIKLPSITVKATTSGAEKFDLVVYIGWENASVKASVVNLTDTNPEATIPPLTLTSSKDAGTNVVVQINASGTFTGSSAKESTLYLSVTPADFVEITTPAKVVEMARNGFRAAYTKNRSFVLTYNEESGDLMLEHHGSMNVPGLLCWGTVSPSGNSISLGGYFVGTVSRIGTGTYRITHTIGHSLYTVIAPGATVTARENDYFEISTGGANAQFDFLVLGSNDGVLI